jgi:ABC-2 type transport system permease protein
MNIRRALSVTKRIFRGLRNDKRTLGMMFIAPIIAMFVFGLAFSGDVKDVHVVVVNNDGGSRHLACLPRYPSLSRLLPTSIRMC